MKKTIYYPLLAGQRVLRYLEFGDVKKTAANIGAIMHFDSAVDRDLLLQSIYLTVLRCTSAKVRLHRKLGNVFQYFSEEVPNPVEILDFSNKTEEALRESAEKWMATPFPKGGLDTQLYKIYLILKSNGFYAVYIRVSRYILDGYGLMQFFTDIVTNFGLLRDGRPIPPAEGDYLTLCRSLWEYDKSEKRQRDLQEIAELCYGTEPQFTPVCPAKFRKPRPDRNAGNLFAWDKSGFRVDLPVEQELAERVKGAAAEAGVSPQAFYYLGIYSYLSKVNGNQRDVFFLSRFSRRENLPGNSTFGALAAALPFRLCFDLNRTTAREAVAVIAERLKRSTDHSGVLIMDMVRMNALRYPISPAIEDYATLAVTFMPDFPVLPEGVKLHMEILGNPYIAHPMELILCPLDDSGGLNCGFSCRNQQTTTDAPYEFHGHLMKTLNAMVKNPNITLRELNALS